MGQRERNQNQHTVAEFVCAECFGALVERLNGAEFVVECAAQPEHQGFTERGVALELEAEEALDKMEIPDAEQRTKLKKALWGED